MGLLPSSEDTLCIRFDSFCKKVLKYRNYKFFRDDQIRKERECVFSDLDEGVLDQFYTLDDYEVLLFWITLKNLTIPIQNEMLYQALLLLSEKRLEIILLSYFMDMTDKEIGEEIQMPKSSVRYNRVQALRYMKKIMEVQQCD